MGEKQEDKKGWVGKVGVGTNDLRYRRQLFLIMHTYQRQISCNATRVYYRFRSFVAEEADIKINRR